jgi:hypothetical protein
LADVASAAELAVDLAAESVVLELGAAQTDAVESTVIEPAAGLADKESAAASLNCSEMQLGVPPAVVLVDVNDRNSAAASDCIWDIRSNPP